MENRYKKIIEEIKNYFSESGIKRAVIGLSGGIDSSLSAKLVCDAIGRENVYGIIMPVKGLSDEDNIKDTKKYAQEYLRIKYCVVYLNDFLKSFENLDWKQGKLAKMNTASRIRAVILYNYANTHDALVIGTSNKTEILLGYFTKFGDGAVDLEVVGSMYKTDEIELAEYIGLPENIINKIPTAELYHGQTDEKEIGAKYAVIDEILKHYERTGNMNEMISKHGKDIVEKISHMMKKAKHKCECAPVIPIN